MEDESRLNGYVNEIIENEIYINCWRCSKLVYMGDSRFCLVTCRKAKDYANNRSLRMLDMASFVIKYKEGELRTAKHRAYGSMSYQMPHQCFDPAGNTVAFWM